MNVADRGTRTSFGATRSSKYLECEPLLGTDHLN